MRQVRVEQGPDEVVVPIFNSRAQAEGAAYAFKKLPATHVACSQVEVYSRQYGFLGVLVAPSWDEISSHPYVVDEWEQWTGGQRAEPGDAVWIDLGVEKGRR